MGDGGVTVEFVRGTKSGKKTTVTATLAGRTVHRDQVNLDVAKERRRFVVAVLSAARPGVPQDDWSPDEIPALDAKLIELADVPAAPPRSSEADRGDAPPDPLGETPRDVIAEAEALLADPRLFASVCDHIQRVGVTGEKVLAATLYLLGVSRLLPRPLNAIVQGASASGKSHVIECTSSLFPPEALIRATQMTPQALFHMKPGGLVHKWVVAGERSRIEEDERAEATRALRELMTANRLSKLIPVKVPGGNIETVLIEQEGPIAFVESTTLNEVFEEDANRCLMLQTDESEEQTRRVITAIAEAAAGGPRPEVGRLTAVHHALQRMLKQLDVVVPFAGRVGELFPAARVDCRRNYGHLINLVKASALLHQLQRRRDPSGNVVAVATDYQIAAALAAVPMHRANGGLGESAVTFYERLANRFGGATVFTSTQARDGEKARRQSVYNWLSALLDAGVVEQIEAGKGKVPAKWKLTGKTPADAGQVIVPPVEKVFPDGDDMSHGHRAQHEVE